MLKQNTEPDPAPDFAAFLALDWADEKHAFRLQAVGQSKIETGTLEQKPEVLGPWLAKLRERFGGRPIAVGLEQSRGALIHALMAYDFLVLYTIHPTTVAKYREAFKSSGAKNDPLDAGQILEILTKHQDRLHRLNPDTVETRLLGRLVEDRRKAVNLRTTHVQALGANLKEYYPQALELTQPAPGFVFLLDHANPIFPEAGHPVVGLLSSRLEPYGGTRGQLVFPCVLAVAFWRKGQPLGFAAACIWFFENGFNIARYLADALAMELPLVGGGDHDWNTILTQWGLLQCDTRIAAVLRLAGWLGIAATCAWVVWRSWRDRCRPAEQPDGLAGA